MNSFGYVAIVGLAIAVRCGISLNGYSGCQKPPLHGDFEAQRHWMEITYHLPPTEWYENTSTNDLQYWGLDYPPLTAYHSWVAGAVAHRMNSSWVELHASRGIETPEHKLFMRLTVLVADLLVYVPAVLCYFYTLPTLSLKDKTAAGILTLLYPGLMLIDHGHFQYNCVSLGLFIWAVVGLQTGHDLWGSAAFMLALNYKQMELYHALPFFCYLLATCFKGKSHWLLRLIKLGVVVVSTFVLCWLPFLQSHTTALQVLNRLFPFTRGLYEDKVANVWCTLSLVIKLKNILSIPAIIRMCLFTTLLGLVPSSIHLFLWPTIKNFKLALVNASLVFFLFSFQVHEKSILLAAIPVCLLLTEHPFACIWFLLVSTLSMLPLLAKDGLLLATVAACVMYPTLASLLWGGPHPASSKPSPPVTVTMQPPSWVSVLFFLSMSGFAVLLVCELKMPPPTKLPDLWPVLLSAYSCGHFVLFLLYFHWYQLTPASRETVHKSTEPRLITQTTIVNQQVQAASNIDVKVKHKKKKTNK